MLSVIVPVYNIEQYLDRCVESILKQSHQDVELLLVDDGSTDSSPAICDAWALRDSRVKVIHQQNAGPSASRNSGLLQAAGEWITFVDSDDYLEPECYEKTLRVLEPSGCDMGIFGVRCESEQGDVFYDESYEEGRVYSVDELITRFVIPLRTAVWNKIFRRSFLAGIRFSDQFRHNEDLLFIVEALGAETKAVTCGCVGYHYVKRAGSITGRGFNPHSIEEIAAKDRACDIIAERFPAHAGAASVLGFIARLNVVRNLKGNRNPEYVGLYSTYMKWLAAYYAQHAKLLSRKHRLVYNLHRYHLSCLIPLFKLFR